jgi:hypothetical protein
MKRGLLRAAISRANALRSLMALFEMSYQCFKISLGQLPIKPPIVRPPIALDAAHQTLTVVINLNQKPVALRTV